MEGDGSHYSGRFHGSPSGMGTHHQVVYDMGQSMTSMEQGTHMPFYPPMMQYVPNQQYMSQGHVPMPEQPQHERADDNMEGNDNEQDDEVQEILASQVPVTEGKKKGACHRGKGYSAEEDRVLCSGWLNISKDATIGTNQDKVAFYKRLRQYYLENYDLNSKRSVNSIQKRWSTIQTRVSRFCAILSRIERLNQSGKSYQDMINDAIKVFQESEPWQFHHSWEMLRDEPKWSKKVLETMQPTRAEKRQEPAQTAQTDTPTQSVNDVESVPQRPEGRDAAKKRRASRFHETSSSSVAVDMLKQMNDRGQQMDEIDSKNKEELVNIERAKYDLAQKTLQTKCDLTLEKLKLQREMNEAQIKVKTHAIDVEQIKVDTQIMFTDPNKLSEGLREWVLKRQMDILIRDGVRPPRSGAGTSSDGS